MNSPSSLRGGNHQSVPLSEEEEEDNVPVDSLMREEGSDCCVGRRIAGAVVGALLVISLCFNAALLIWPKQQQQQTTTRRTRTPKYLPKDVLLPSWKPLPTELPTHIAFGSCSDQTVTLDYWDTLISLTAKTPDLFVMMGDNVYGDCEEGPSCTRLSDAYRNLSLHPSFQSAVTQIPVIATLDDHDYGLNDCSADNPHKDLARQWFIEFFDEQEAPDDGVYKSHVWTDDQQRTMQLILLDTRYNRDAFVSTRMPSHPYRPVSESKPQQMLGERQWRWLEAQLQEPATFRILISSIQVLNNSTGLEAWRHLPTERERLVRLLQNRSTLILSGDRHVGAFYESSGLVEVTSSSLTHSVPLGAFNNCSTAEECDEEDEARVGDMIRTNQFGLLEVDWEQRTVTVSLRRADTLFGFSFVQRGKPGEVLAKHTFKIDEL